MGRWEPNARERLEQAALALFQERGYARTTVDEIAARAGLTERTFFRYFSDKREVLFSRSADLEKLITDGVTHAPSTMPAFDAVVVAIEAAAAGLQQQREFAHVKARHALVAAHAELRERELIKLASLGAALAGALRKRGVAEPAASLSAEAGIAMFKVGFERWVSEAEPGDFVHHIRVARRELRTVTAAGGVAAASAKSSSAPRAPSSSSRRRLSGR